ncbi:MAG TPA: signal recognition particle receptor subunit alpha, partial [Thermoanaerobaculia bacterium]|nr:signal recognition particle receptor subunit alpha [Thermoanaerobaculia bacterium]
MFDTLADRLQGALGDVRSRGALTEEDVAKAMRQVRLALLEADVNFKVVKQFTAAVKERATGSDVLESLNPGQQVVKVVADELTELMGGSGRDLVFSKSGPTARRAPRCRRRTEPRALASVGRVRHALRTPPGRPRRRPLARQADRG